MKEARLSKPPGPPPVSGERADELRTRSPAADAPREWAGKNIAPPEEPPSGPLFRKTDATGRIQFTKDALQVLGVSEADAATLLASTQAYLDVYAEMQKHHLEIRKLDANQVEFSIESFASDGQGIRDGVSSLWLRYLDAAGLAGIWRQVGELFGGEEEGFGAYRVVAKARRELDGEGPVTTTEQYFTPLGEKKHHQIGMSSGMDGLPITDCFSRYSHLFKKP